MNYNPSDHDSNYHTGKVGMGCMLQTVIIIAIVVLTVSFLVCS